MPEAQDVYTAAGRAKEWFSKEENETQIAFFGGSFTAIDRGYMESLLKAAQDVVNLFGLCGIRISTRPDCIDAEILSVLKSYGVTAIELGAQSMCDEVLRANHRGHTARDAEQASAQILESGFELGLQMMTGLYMDTPEKSVETAKRLIALRPQTVRIYPTLVLRDTELEELLNAGVYHPQTLDEAVTLCAELLPLFDASGIAVIRVGLHDEPSLRDGVVAGPYHPAFRELCLSRIFLNRMLRQLQGALARNGGFKYNIRANPKSLSAVIGHKRHNIEYLTSKGFDVHVTPDPEVPPGALYID